MRSKSFLALGLCFLSSGALADQTQRDYGLHQTEVDGVIITRGKAYSPKRTFPSEAQRPAKTMALGDAYRGSVFGKHRVVRDGQTVYRDVLLPIRQEGQ